MEAESLTDSGYSIAQSMLSDSQCDDLLNSLATSSLHRSRAGARHLMSQAAIQRIALDPRLLRLAEEALGVNPQPYRATLFEKSGTANWLVVWHQDTALPLRSRFDLPGWGPWSLKSDILYGHAPAWALSHIVALRVHLDASTLDTGPLRVLPGTHAMGVMTDSEVFALAHTTPHVDCLVQRGGIMTMHPLLVHSSRKARSPEPRRVLHIEYSDSLTLAPGVQLAIA